MKTLVIGKSGQLASSFKKVDIENRLSFLGKENFDYSDRASIHSALDTFRPEIIINCAAYTLVDMAEVETQKAYDLNVQFVVYLTEWCIQNNCKLIHFSTDYVFDGKKNGPYLESDPTQPINVYGRTKAESEKFLMSSSLETIIFRISWVYSEFGNNFLKTMIKLAQDKTELKIVSDQVGSPCYAVNVAEVIYNWIFHRKLEGFNKGIYHLTPENKMSWFEFAKLIFESCKSQGIKLKIKNTIPIHHFEFPAKALRPLNSCMNSKKAEKELGLALDPVKIAVETAIANFFK